MSHVRRGRAIVAPSALAAIALLLGGCRSTPASTDLSLPAGALKSGPSAGATAPFERSHDPAWWRQFGSERLDRLVEQALRSNPRAEVAAATLRQAEALRAAHAGSAFWPVASAGLNVQRQRAAENFDPSPGNPTQTITAATMQVRYDFDLFGAHRQTLTALAARVDYERFQSEGVALQLAGEVVTTALRQGQALARLRAQEEIAMSREAELRIVEHRYELGAVAMREVEIARLELEQARAELPRRREHLEQLGHALDVLVGETPGRREREPFGLDDFAAVPALPSEIPFAWLRQRPDLRAAEALVAAADAERGAAVARQYPQLVVTAGATAQAAGSADWWSGNALAWNLVGEVAGPLLDRGRRHKVTAASAALQAAVARHRELAQHIFQDVAGLLGSRFHASEVWKRQAAALEHAADLLRQAELIHAAGSSDVLPVLAARRNLHLATAALQEARAGELLVAAMLLQSIGRAEPPPRHEPGEVAVLIPGPVHSR